MSVGWGGRVSQTRAEGPREPGERSRVGQGAPLGSGGLSRQTAGLQGRVWTREWVSGLNPTSSFLRGLEPAPLPTGLGPAVGIGALRGQAREFPLSLLPACCPHSGIGELGTFVCVCAGFTPWLDGSFRLFYLRTEVTLRFMGAINPCPISTLIEAIRIVTKIIRDNFIGIFKKIITFHIFKLRKCGGRPAGLPRPKLGGPVLEDPCLPPAPCTSPEVRAELTVTETGPKGLGHSQEALPGDMQ